MARDIDATERHSIETGYRGAGGERLDAYAGDRYEALRLCIETGILVTSTLLLILVVSLLHACWLLIRGRINLVSFAPSLFNLSCLIVVVHSALTTLVDCWLFPKDTNYIRAFPMEQPRTGESISSELTERSKEDADGPRY
jgi:hypothetical protein